jgi:hypothetical protein
MSVVMSLHTSGTDNNDSNVCFSGLVLPGIYSGSSLHNGREYQREADDQNAYKQILGEG